jgi:hypothetical protein
MSYIEIPLSVRSSTRPVVRIERDARRAQGSVANSQQNNPLTIDPQSSALQNKK